VSSVYIVELCVDMKNIKLLNVAMKMHKLIVGAIQMILYWCEQHKRIYVFV
jgi:hypothetical protein